MIVFLNFFIFFSFLDAKNTKYIVKSSKLVGNKQTMHICVEELKEIFFHASSAMKTPKTMEISIVEKVAQKGGGSKKVQLNCKKIHDLSNLDHINQNISLIGSRQIQQSTCIAN